MKLRYIINLIGLFLLSQFSFLRVEGQVIISQPTNMVFCSSGSATFSLIATNTTTYQWQIESSGSFTDLSNTFPYLGVTTAMLKINDLSGLNGKNFRCRISGNSGTIYSNVVSLSITSSSPVISYPTSTTVYYPGSAITPITPIVTGEIVKASYNVVSTLAGFGTSGYADGSSSSAEFNNPYGVAVAPNGIVYVADYGNHRIRKIDPITGDVSTLAGSGVAGFNDALGTSAQFNSPVGLIVALDGFIYVADYGNHRIRKIDPANGQVSTLAGSSTAGSINGTGTSAQFRNPTGLAVSIDGYIYVADQGNHLIRKIDRSTAQVSTLAGSGSIGTTDGTGTAAKFNYPVMVVVAPDGILYVSDQLNNRIRRIDPNTAQVSTFAGSSSGYFDAAGTNAQFNNPIGLAASSDGFLYVADYNNHRIRKIDLYTQKVYTLAGNSLGYLDGSTPVAKFYNPFGLGMSLDGIIYVGDRFNQRIRKIKPTTFTISPDLSSGLNFNTNTGVISGTPIVGTQNTTYTISTQNDCGSASTNLTFEVANQIVMQPVSGKICTGNPTSFNINATNALTYQWQIENSGSFIDLANSSPYSGINTSTLSIANSTGLNGKNYRCVLTGNTGILYSDTVSLMISTNPPVIAYSGVNNTYLTGSAITPLVPSNSGGSALSVSNIVSTLAGNGITGFVDGSGASAEFASPFGIAVAPDGFIYIADTDNNRIRKIDPVTGRVTTLAGSTYGFNDGPGSTAQFRSPTGIAVGPDGNIYVADYTNHRIRKINPANGETSTLAGSTLGYRNGHPTNQAQFNYPTGVAVGKDGFIYVVDYGNQRIRKIDLVNNRVTTLAGSGNQGFIDGIGVAAQFDNPYGICLTNEGYIFVADQNNNRIRKINPVTVEVTTLAGGSMGYNDGTGTAAQFNNPSGIAAGSDGFLYVSDYGNQRIRKINPFTALVSTFSGNGNYGYQDGLSSDAEFASPNALAASNNGFIYITDTDNNRIRQIGQAAFTISPNLPPGLEINPNSGLISGIPISASQSTTYTILAQNTCGSSTSTITFATEVSNQIISQPTDVSLCSGSQTSFSLIATNASAYQWQIESSGSFTNLSNTAPYSGVTSPTLNISSVTGLNGKKYRCRITGNTGTIYTNIVSLAINSPSIAYNGLSGFYLTGTAITPLNPSNTGGTVLGYSKWVSTLSGSGTAGFQDGNSSIAKFNNPTGLAVAPNGFIYVADFTNHRIRKIDLSTGQVTAIAGNGVAGYLDGNGTAAQFNNPYGITVAPNGFIYVADLGNNRIRKIDPNTSQVSTLAGSGGLGSNNGIGIAAQFKSPAGVVVASDGFIYVADQKNHLIRKINLTTAMVTTLAGDGISGFSNGVGTAARFSSPTGIAVASDGFLYVADYDNNRIRKINSITGEVSTLAGSIGGSNDGIGTAALFRNPSGVSIALDGYIYVSENGNHLIRKINPITAEVTTLAGNGTSGFQENNGTNAQFNVPTGLTVASDGAIYIADKLNNRIRKIGKSPFFVINPSLPGNLSINENTGVISGTPVFEKPNTSYIVTTQNGCGSNAIPLTFATQTPSQITTQPNEFDVCGLGGNFTVSATYASSYQWQIETTGGFIDLSNTATYNGVTTPTLSISYPMGLGQNGEKYRCRITGNSGDLFSNTVSIPYNFPVISYSGVAPLYVTGSSITPLNPTNVGGPSKAIVNWVDKLAGNGTAGFQDGSNNAQFNTPIAVAVGSDGIVYVADKNNHRIRKIDPTTGQVSTLAGSGIAGFNDGNTTAAQFNSPSGLAVASNGLLYVADFGNHRIRKIDPTTGQVSTLAGSTNGYLDEIGTEAKFNNPTGLAIAPDGFIYVADTYNHKIRKIDPTTGQVSTLAGSSQGYIDNFGANAQFNLPTGIAISTKGFIYLADKGNNRIRKIDLFSGQVTTFAGSTSGYLDNTGSSAQFNSPTGVAIAADGFIYVADANNNRIRKINSNTAAVSTWVGNGIAGNLDGLPANSQFNIPSGIAITSGGTIYIADQSNHQIRKIGQGPTFTISPTLPSGLTMNKNTGVVSGIPTIGSPSTTYTVSTQNGCGTVSTNLTFAIQTPTQITAQPSNANACSGTQISFNISVTNATEYQWQIETSGGFTDLGESATYSGVNTTTLSINSSSVLNGKNYRCRIIGNNGNLYSNTVNLSVTDTRLITYEGVSSLYLTSSTFTPLSPAISGGPVQAIPNWVSTLVGSGTAGHLDGNNATAQFNTPSGLALGSDGFVYVADNSNHRIRKIDPTTGQVTTLAGSGTAGFNDGTTTTAQFYNPSGIAVAPNGIIYVADYGNHRIRKIDPTNGQVTTLAGSTIGYLDETGTAAKFSYPSGLAVASDGIIYVADTYNHRIRKIDPATGQVTTLAGGTSGFLDNIGTAAKFNMPTGVGISTNGFIYIADKNNHRIRKIDPISNQVTTIAGSTAGYLDNTGTSAQFSNPTGVAIAVDDFIYVADANNNRIRKINPNTTVVSTWAGNGTAGFNDGLPYNSQFNSPSGITLSSGGIIYLADRANHRIRKIGLGPTFTISPTLPSGLNLNPGSGEISGNPTVESPSTTYTVTTQNGCGSVTTNLTFGTQTPSQITTQPTNAIVCSGTPVSFSINVNNAIAHQWQIETSGSFTDLTDTAPYSGVNISTLSINSSSVLNGKNYRCRITGNNGTLFSNTVNLSVSTIPSIVYNGVSSVYTKGSAITPLSPTNSGDPAQAIPNWVSTLAGSGTAGYLDGNNATAQFNTPSGLAVGSDGFIYVADNSNHRIRKIDPVSGQVTTLAGSGTAGFNDGTTITAQFNNPTGVAIAPNGIIYVADNGNHRIRKIDPTTGQVTTMAGSGQGFSNGSGITAQFNSPFGLAVAPDGFIYVADTYNHRIRKIDPANGQVTNLAGSGNASFGDGIGSAANFYYPTGVGIGSNGIIYVADTYNERIRIIDPSTGQVSTLAGSGTQGYLDGIGIATQFDSPTGVSVSPDGSIYVADANNNRIRKINPNTTVVSTWAGTSYIPGYRDGTAAAFYRPVAVAFSPDGLIYVADRYNYRIRKIGKLPFSISPALPSGLTMNVNTGVISGTATSISPSTMYTVSTQNNCGSATTSFTFAVQIQPVNITVTPALPSICPNNSITLTANGCSGNVTWSDGATTLTGNSVQLSPTTTTVYTVTCSTGGSTSVTLVVAVPNLTVSEDVLTGKKLEKAIQTLQSNRKIGSVGSPAPNVIYEAGNAIILQPGFEVSQQGTFLAQIKSCPGN